MATAGIFKLIANDGKADKMLMATELLNKRIKEIICLRQKMRPQDDPTPTLLDIERTHVLFVNAHFKPFAAVAYEYQRVRSSAGNPNWGGNVQFSIPQFGDFFSDMAANIQLAAASCTAGTVPAFPNVPTGSTIVTDTTSQRLAKIEDTTNGVYTEYNFQYVDYKGNAVSVGDAATNFIRYAEYPAERFYKSIAFTVNGNPLDDYDEITNMNYRKFNVMPNKLTGWKRLVGQEVPVEGYTDLLAANGANQYPSTVAGKLDTSGALTSSFPSTSLDNARQVVRMVTGAQTPKTQQPAQNWFLPILLWFCRDVKLAVPSVSIPYGQRFLTMEINPQSSVVFAAPGAIRLKCTTTVTTSAGTNRGLVNAQAVTDTKTYVTYQDVFASGSAPDTTQQISLLELYVNNIFVNPEIHDIYIRRIGFTLVRVHRTQTNRLSTQSELQLSQLKWPIETMYVGLRPTANIDSTNNNQYRDWHRYTFIEDQIVDLSASSAGKFVIDNTVAFNAADPNVKTISSQETFQHITYPQQTEVATTLQLKAHGIVIYDAYTTPFYNAYIPWNYGKDTIVTPEDPGAYMFQFGFYPGSYQPSGHINISRAREFFINVASSSIDQNNQVDLLILAIAINFLLITDGNALMRYST